LNGGICGNTCKNEDGKGFSQEELAKRVGVTQAAIWQYENHLATPKIAIAISIANALGTTCEALMGGKEEEK
jgi:transcriptional regulator with XRE-family HTH domain